MSDIQVLMMSMMEKFAERMAPKESFSLRDFLAMQERTEARLEKIQERQDAARDREREEHRRYLVENKPKGLGEILETVKGLREAQEILGGNGGDNSIIREIFGLLSNPDALQGIQGIITAAKGDEGEYSDEEGGEGEPIETTARAVPPGPGQEIARRQPPTIVKPEELGRQEYPAAFDVTLSAMVEKSAKDEDDPAAARAQLESTMKCLFFLAENDKEWRRIVTGAVMRIAFKGPKMVMPYIHGFLAGLVQAKKLPEANAAVLEKIFATNAEAVTAFLKAKVSGAK